MMYCESCMKLTDESKCPFCKRKKLREARHDDPVYILTQDATFARSVEDILSKNGIPCIKRGFLGEGITSYVGFTLEAFRFYVPYAAYGKAREVLGNFLEESNDENNG